MIENYLKRPWQAVAVVGLIQSAILGYMVWDRVQLLRGGEEFVLDVVPVDPRSLFRGDYVILGYDVSSVDGSLLRGPVERNEVLYVTIAKDGEGKWKPVGASKSRCRSAGAGRDEARRVRAQGPLRQRGRSRCCDYDARARALRH